MWRGELENVRESLERSAKISEEIEDLRGLSSAYYDISTLLRTESDFSASEIFVKKCLKAARKSGSKTEIARAYRAMGAVKNLTGKRDESIKVRQMAVDYAKESDDLALLSYCYGSLASDYYEEKQYDDALDLDYQALDSARNSGDAGAIAWSLSGMASTLISKEDFDTATECIDEAVEIYQRLQEHGLLAQIYIQCGYVYEDKDWGKAKDFLNKSLNLINEFGNLAQICEYYISVGALYRWRGDDEWQTYIDKAKDILAKIKDPKVIEKLEHQIQVALTDTPKDG
jgi:tetratricopeptide (TPR) repeat protein